MLWPLPGACLPLRPAPCSFLTCSTITAEARGIHATSLLVPPPSVLPCPLQKLEEHRKKCEVDGRYAEARAAAKRLAELRTAQVSRLRQELLANQSKELAEVNVVYEEETGKFSKVRASSMHRVAT